MSAVAPKETAHSRGEFALAKISTNWKGNGVAAAITAASETGMLIAGNMVGYDKARTAVSRGFNVRLIDEKYWSTVYEAFQSGRSAQPHSGHLSTSGEADGGVGLGGCTGPRPHARRL